MPAIGYNSRGPPIVPSRPAPKAPPPPVANLHTGANPRGVAIIPSRPAARQAPMAMLGAAKARAMSPPPPRQTARPAPKSAKQQLTSRLAKAVQGQQKGSGQTPTSAQLSKLLNALSAANPGVQYRWSSPEPGAPGGLEVPAQPGLPLDFGHPNIPSTPLLRSVPVPYAAVSDVITGHQPMGGWRLPPTGHDRVGATPAVDKHMILPLQTAVPPSRRTKYRYAPLAQPFGKNLSPPSQGEHTRANYPASYE